MTNQELNRDIKRLYKKVLNSKEINEDMRKEFSRLYGADKCFNYMNKTSILMMAHLCSKYRFIEPFRFILYAGDSLK